ncbi:MAG TPA: class I SAM-dependent methyltransferase [Candidatus Micrarchaeaceae archaeon]|nr:class I SAM-dependent methyltransferase [Candidatus Micrarchaeaceae archaeon]
MTRNKPPMATPKLYGELAEWWPTFSTPEEYRVEATFFTRVLAKTSSPAPRTVLELGSGGGNSAFHLKSRFAMTLVDLSPNMLAVSRALNPECEHIEADIRTVRLGQTFDAVFVHDAICHMTTEAELRAALKTAFVHCRPGGAALFAPDFVRETFFENVDQGGNDTDRGSVRFLQWTTDPDPRDTSYFVDFAILIRDRRGRMRVEHDRHHYGLFSRADWRRWLRDVGFELKTPRAALDGLGRDFFVGHRKL